MRRRATLALQAGAARAELKKQWIEYKDGNAPLYGYLVYDDAVTGKRPGVLMAHNRAGMSQTVIDDSDMVAKLGYVVFAADIFGKGVLPKDVPEMTAQTTIYNQNRPLMRSRATAGFDVLKANPLVDPARIAVVGYCFGGTVAVGTRRDRRSDRRHGVGARLVPQLRAGSRREHQGPGADPARRRGRSCPLPEVIR